MILIRAHPGSQLDNVLRSKKEHFVEISFLEDKLREALALDKKMQAQKRKEQARFEANEVANKLLEQEQTRAALLETTQLKEKLKKEEKAKREELEVTLREQRLQDELLEAAEHVKRLYKQEQGTKPEHLAQKLQNEVLEAAELAEKLHKDGQAGRDGPKVASPMAKAQGEEQKEPTQPTAPLYVYIASVMNPPDPIAALVEFSLLPTTPYKPDLFHHDDWDTLFRVETSSQIYRAVENHRGGDFTTVTLDQEEIDQLIPKKSPRPKKNWTVFRLLQKPADPVQAVMELKLPIPHSLKLCDYKDGYVLLRLGLDSILYKLLKDLPGGNFMEVILTDEEADALVIRKVDSTQYRKDEPTHPMK